MNNTKRFVFVSFSILLVVALFVAMICFYFLPFGEEKVFAEVSSISTGVEYDFSYTDPFLSTAFVSSQWSTSWSNLSFSSVSGSIYYSGSLLYTFSSVRKRRSSGTSNPYAIQFYNDDNNNVSFGFHNNIANGSTYAELGMFAIKQNGSNLSSPVYNNLSISFTTYNVSSSADPDSFFNTFMHACLSEPAIDYTPVFTVYSQDYPSQNTYLLGLLGYNANLLWNPVVFYSGTFDSIQFTNYSDLFDGYESPMPDLIFEYSYNFKDGDSWYHDNTTTYTISLNPDATFIPIFNSYLNVSTAESHNVTWFIQPISFYYDGYSDYKYEFDSTSSTFLDNQFCNIANLNNMYLDIYSGDYHTHSNISSYNLGYADGLDADQTLVSAIWAVFDMPFKLLFGTWDTSQSEYVGGLFNFHVLGVDIRAFVLGLLSACIVVAIIRFILGAKG